MFLGLPLILAGGSQSSAGGLRIFGAVIACYGVANLVMNIVVGNRTLPPFSRRLILWGIMLNGAGIMLIGLAALASVPMPLIYAGAALAGGGGPMNDIPRSTLMQTAVPAGDVAAAFRAWMIMANAGVVLAIAAAPVVFTVAGPGVGVALCGAMIAGAGLWGMGQRTLRRM